MNATSPSGAFVPFDSFGHDNVGVTSFDCSRVSGTKFPIGRTFVSCSAVDAAGNKSLPASLVVNVLGAQEQIVNLIASIRAVLPSGGDWDDHDHYGRRGHRRNELLYALTSALSSSRNPRNACPALDAIAVIVRANTPAVFTTADGTQIRADISRIKNVIGCR